MCLISIFLHKMFVFHSNSVLAYIQNFWECLQHSYLLIIILWWLAIPGSLIILKMVLNTNFMHFILVQLISLKYCGSVTL